MCVPCCRPAEIDLLKDSMLKKRKYLFLRIVLRTIAVLSLLYAVETILYASIATRFIFKQTKNNAFSKNETIL